MKTVVMNPKGLTRAENSYPFNVDEVRRRYREDPPVQQHYTTDDSGYYLIPVKQPLPPDAEDHTSVLGELRMNPDLVDSPVFDPEHVSPFDKPKP